MQKPDYILIDSVEENNKQSDTSSHVTLHDREDVVMTGETCNIKVVKKRSLLYD